MRVNLKNRNGHLILTKTGFSWTVFFFGWIVPLVRKDWKWAAVMFASTLIMASVLDVAAVGIAIGFSFIYNNLYITEMLARGYYGNTDLDEDILRSEGFYNVK